MKHNKQEFFNKKYAAAFPKRNNAVRKFITALYKVTQ